jgi:hypothetical protein
MNGCPSTWLDYAIWPSNYSERILFGLARDDGAGRAISVITQNTVENENRYSVLMSLNYIPDLCDLSAGGVTNPRKPAREWRTDLGVRGVPPFRSGGTDVLETPSGRESAHSPCAKHEKDFGHAKN